MSKAIKRPKLIGDIKEIRLKMVIKRPKVIGKIKNIKASKLISKNLKSLETMINVKDM